MTFARIVDGRVAEVLPAVAEFDGVAVPLTDRYHPDFVAALVECPDEVQPDWMFDGVAWQPPSDQAPEP